MTTNEWLIARNEKLQAKRALTARAALEEAAKRVESYPTDLVEHSLTYRVACKDMAGVIRALAASLPEARAQGVERTVEDTALVRAVLMLSKRHWIENGTLIKPEDAALVLSDAVLLAAADGGKGQGNDQ